MRYLIIVLLLSGCSTWTTYIHEKEQEQFRQELWCESVGGTFKSSAYYNYTCRMEK